MNNKPFWITIARDGETINRRQIPAQLLLELDASYDQQLFNARVWTGSGERIHQLPIGDVNATKIEKRDGVTWLLALIKPDNSFQDLFRRLNNPDTGPLPLYPRLEYFPAGMNEFGGKPYISGISAVVKPTFANLEPFNNHAVKHEPPIYRSI